MISPGKLRHRRNAEAPAISPAAEQNEADAQGQVSGPSIARDIVDRHVSALQSRRQMELLWEKLLLHIDGTGDFQWADIYDGMKVMIPRMLSPYRKTDNVLRLLVDNAIAYHTTQEFRFLAESQSDRRSRQRALMDTLFLNDLSHRQDFNGLFAEGLALAMATGFCLIHGYWRDDLTHDWYDPVGYADSMESVTPDDPDQRGPMDARDVPKGMIDCFTGNPFDTVFDRAATRRSQHWCSYARLVPAKVVRERYGHIEGVKDLQGSTRLPSSAIFQRIAQSWDMSGVGVHGKAFATHRSDDEEMVTLVCREIAPKYAPEYPEGRLQLAVVPGSVDLRRGAGNSGHAILLADQGLPGGTFSFAITHSSHRSDDVHGKPWAEPMDQMQVDLNLAKSKRWEYIQKMVESPIVTPGGMISDQMNEIGGYNMIEVDQSMASWHPRAIDFSQAPLIALKEEIDDIKSSMFTAGGYQAASRGELPGSRTPYRAIVALQQADRTIHGPVNQRFQRAVCDFGRRCWAQMKAYGDVGWVVDVVGDEYEHLAQSYVDKEHLSERPPQYKLVNAFGVTPEMKAQEIVELLGVQTAEGPFLRLEEARKAYPNRELFDDVAYTGSTRRRRAKTVAEEIHNYADLIRERTGVQSTRMSDPQIQQLGQMVFMAIEEEFKRLRDDDLQAHLTSLSDIVQDESSDPIARVAAQIRQDLYFQWQNQMAMQAQGMAPGGGGGAPPGGQPDGNPQISDVDRQGVAAEMGGGRPTGGQGGVAR